jgi:hypothetical protein
MSSRAIRQAPCHTAICMRIILSHAEAAMSGRNAWRLALCALQENE